MPRMLKTQFTCADKSIPFASRSTDAGVLYRWRRTIYAEAVQRAQEIVKRRELQPAHALMAEIERNRKPPFSKCSWKA